MIALLRFLLTLSVSPFKSKSRLEAENAALRHQLIVLQRRVRGRVQLTNGDRLFLVLLYRWFPSVLRAITIVRPETLVRWHRAGFRRYWRWKSRPLGGRPQIETELRVLIRRMSVENPFWGAPSHPVQRTGSIKSFPIQADSITTTPGSRSYAGATGGRGVLPVRFPFHRCIGETLMEIRTVNNLPSAATHDDAVRCLLAIELS